MYHIEEGRGVLRILDYTFVTFKLKRGQLFTVMMDHSDVINDVSRLEFGQRTTDVEERRRHRFTKSLHPSFLGLCDMLCRLVQSSTRLHAS